MRQKAALAFVFVKVLTNVPFSYIMKKIVREKIQRWSKGELDGETKL